MLNKCLKKRGMVNTLKCTPVRSGLNIRIKSLDASLEPSGNNFDLSRFLLDDDQASAKLASILVVVPLGGNSVDSINTIGLTTPTRTEKEQETYRRWSPLDCSAGSRSPCVAGDGSARRRSLLLPSRRSRAGLVPLPVRIFPSAARWCPIKGVLEPFVKLSGEAKKKEGRGSTLNSAARWSLWIDLELCCAMDISSKLSRDMCRPVNPAVEPVEPGSGGNTGSIKNTGLHVVNEQRQSYLQMMIIQIDDYTCNNI
ncbi:hypothetical protein LXL04_014973 [Taraxacum kok-saghyz]